MLSAGSNVEWLRDDLGIIATSADSHDVAAAVDDTDGVVYVPALLGLGTPHWDYGARGTLLGLTRGTRAGRSSCGPCSRASPTAAPTSSRRPRPTTGLAIATLRVDGGMSANPTFIQALADAAGRPVEVSPVRRGDDTGRGVPRRAGDGRVGRHRRDADRAWTPAPCRRARAGPSIGSAWAEAVERPPAGSPSCRPSTSDATADPVHRPGPASSPRPPQSGRARSCSTMPRPGRLAPKSST